ncbi:MAG: Slp family lipoprotein [Wenzhouxiangellaceae bacterium]|nr:Slp family lipoprotein [Wenzhouxiangellaceae bacterium]
MNSVRMIAMASVMAMAGCVSIPEPLEGDYSQAFFPEQATENSIGARVRWGGTIVETNPQSDRTCVEVLSRELTGNYQPERSDTEHGRFLACKEQFIDPEVFENGREVTVVGRLESFTAATVGEFVYRYPIVDAESIYLWPESETYAGRGYYGYGYYGYPYGRFYYPYYPRYGHHRYPYRSGFFYR